LKVPACGPGKIVSSLCYTRKEYGKGSISDDVRQLIWSSFSEYETVQVELIVDVERIVLSFSVSLQDCKQTDDIPQRGNCEPHPDSRSHYAPEFPMKKLK
jgi:hypothetical protein